MAPHAELVMEYPQPFCLANTGEEYIIYLRYGGVAKLKMDAFAAFLVTQGGAYEKHREVNTRNLS